MDSRSSIKEMFESFFVERAKEKDRLYSAAVYFALVVTLASTFLQVLSSVYENSFRTSSDFNAVMTVSNFCRVVGVSIYSTVPTDEFDLFEEMSREGNDRFKITVSLLAGGATIIGSILSSIQEEIHETALMIPIAIWYLFNIPFKVTYGQIALKTHLGFCTWHIKLVCGAIYQCTRESTNSSSPHFFVRYFPILIAAVGLIGLTWCMYLFANTYQNRIYSVEDISTVDEKDKGFAANVLNSMVYILCVETGVQFLLSGASSLSSGGPDYFIWFVWSVADLSPLVLVFIMGKQACFTLLARFYELNMSRLQHDGAFLAELVNQCEVVDKVNKIEWIWRSGSKKTAAGKQEQQEQQQREEEESDPDRVKRSFWMKGSFVADEEEDEEEGDGWQLVTVDFREDVDRSWTAAYLDTHVRFYLHPNPAAGPPAIDDEVTQFDGGGRKGRPLPEEEAALFDEWVDRNFDQKNSSSSILFVSKNYSDGTVTIKVKQESSHRHPRPATTTTSTTVTGPQHQKKDIEQGDVPTTSSSTTTTTIAQRPSPSYFPFPFFYFPPNNRRAVRVQPDSDLLQWARNNLRMLEWARFEPDLLHTSPREIRDDAEKTRLFNLSTPLSWEHLRHHDRKIDFFVSHSWDDCPGDKTRALREFSAGFELQHGRRPTFWLDKVCIDQRDTGRGVAALPIHIAACRGMLVLLSRSYMKRLWCVWELFSLFTFCNKELAIERIHIRPVKTKTPGDDGQVDIPGELRGFDINRAHCFGPNEEFKLRAILHEVGIDRLADCMAALARTYQRKKLEQQQRGIFFFYSQRRAF